MPSVSGPQLLSGATRERANKGDSFEFDDPGKERKGNSVILFCSSCIDFSPFVRNRLEPRVEADISSSIVFGSDSDVSKQI